MRDDLFAKHAALQAIAARRLEAERKRDRAEVEIDWLARLVEARQGQIDRGEWPGKDIPS